MLITRRFKWWVRGIKGVLEFRVPLPWLGPTSLTREGKHESIRVARLKTIRTRFYDRAVTSRVDEGEGEGAHDRRPRDPSLLKTPFSTLQTSTKRSKTVFISVTGRASR